MFEKEEKLGNIINYILEKYHKKLKIDLPELEELINKIVQVHGDIHSELKDIKNVFKLFMDEMLNHLKKEEEILFPLMLEIDRAYSEKIKLGQFHCGSIGNPISRMELEHSNFEEYLLKIRNLTNNYFIDSDACKTYRKVFEMLQELEKETIEHAGLENNILHKLAMKKELELC